MRVLHKGRQSDKSFFFFKYYKWLLWFSFTLYFLTSFFITNKPIPLSGTRVSGSKSSRVLFESANKTRHKSKPKPVNPDVVSIPKTNEDFRLLYDTKGRFRLHAITGDETKFKLCKVRSVQFGQKGIPYLNTYDGRTIRYPDPLIKANDTIKLDLESNKIVDFIKFDVGNVVMVTGGRNRGRVGVIKNREKHKGSFETIHVQDAAGHEFATRLGNVFTIGKGIKPWVSLPKGKGIKLSIIEEARKRLAAQVAA
ncbi:40S ribosomal protein S4 [Hibiscus syriacus]|uniref:40S ribosomal protein S4 n=1 Tax=Hibiscus syriacus TaxID=106335 RepID=A0A6A2ZWD1_HIBSY|nr:40S ribosomal protein S4 [Hibiscus syriacus]